MKVDNGGQEPSPHSLKTTERMKSLKSDRYRRAPYLGLHIILDEDRTSHLRKAAAAYNLHNTGDGVVMERQISKISAQLSLITRIVYSGAVCMHVYRVLCICYASTTSR